MARTRPLSKLTLDALNMRAAFLAEQETAAVAAGDAEGCLKLALELVECLEEVFRRQPRHVRESKRGQEHAASLADFRADVERGDYWQEKS